MLLVVQVVIILIDPALSSLPFSSSSQVRGIHEGLIDNPCVM